MSFSINIDNILKISTVILGDPFSLAYMEFTSTVGFQANISGVMITTA